MVFCCASSVQADKKMYVDAKEIKSKQDAFYLHKGNNMWIQTNKLNRDSSGLFIMESNIKRNPNTSEWEKMWKCPYCYKYWPMGTPCQNSSCPSKF